VPIHAQRLGHLRLQNLVEHRFHQFRQTVLTAQQPWQQILSYVNIISSHRFFSFWLINAS
jgi:hypothetical protein